MNIIIISMNLIRCRGPGLCRPRPSSATVGPQSDTASKEV